MPPDPPLSRDAETPSIRSSGSSTPDPESHRRLTAAFLAIRELGVEARARALIARDDLDETLMSQIRRLLEFDQRPQLPLDRPALEGSAEQIARALETLVEELRRRGPGPGPA